jgi:hypothetical protein
MPTLRVLRRSSVYGYIIAGVIFANIPHQGKSEQIAASYCKRCVPRSVASCLAGKFFGQPSYPLS